MGVILQYKGALPPDDLERIADAIQKDLQTQGFVVLDEKFKIIKLDDEKED